MSEHTYNIVAADYEIGRRIFGFRRYAKRSLMIRDKQTQQLIPFKLNGLQEVLHAKNMEYYEQHGMIRSVVLKMRQGGSSTYWCGLGFSRAAQHPYHRFLMLAHDKETSETLFEIVSIFYEELAAHTRPNYRSFTKDTLDFRAKTHEVGVQQRGLSNLRSSIRVLTAGTRGAGIGRQTTELVLSEAARFRETEDIKTGVMQAVPYANDTIIAIESTAHPRGRWFKAEYEDAKSGMSNFQAIFVPWFVASEYAIHGANIKHYTKIEAQLKKFFFLTDAQIAWRRWKIRELSTIDNETGVSGEDLFAQEYPVDDQECWRAAGQGVFKNGLDYQETCVRDPIVIGDLIGYDDRGMGGRFIRDVGIANKGKPPLQIWEYPKDSREYYIGADVALGLPGGDYSCAIVFDSYTMEQVASWHGHIEPLDFAALLAALGRMYNTAQVGPETNSHGYATHATLVQIYPNFYRTKRREQQQLEYDVSTVGWYTSRKTKRYLISLGQNYIGKEKIKLRDAQLVDDLRHYVCLDEDDWGADAGYRDDRVMALLITLTMYDDEAWTYGDDAVVGYDPADISVAEKRPWEFDTEQWVDESEYTGIRWQ